MYATFALLSDPTRLRIIELLRDNQQSVTQLNSHIKSSQPLISRHLRMLREAGLVKREVKAQQRIYSLQPNALVELDDWIEMFRPLWKNRLDALEAHVQQMHEDKHA